MRIHSSFVGGNARIVGVYGNDVFVEQELRDTTTWWFYWAFCVEGAAGRTLTFHFTNGDVVGYWGPAVSIDNIYYNWAGKHTRLNGTSFKYTFGLDENRVFFRSAIPYQLSNYENWLRKQASSITTDVLCLTERGRNVPYFILGNPDATSTILFTSRHHACESMASWALEGAVDECVLKIKEISEMDCNVICIPFIDLDGVEDGDQGKNRSPHDQNRDYLRNTAIYKTIRATMDIANKKRVIGYIDFHDPWYLGDINDHVYIYREDQRRHNLSDDFCAKLIALTNNGHCDTIVYDGKWDIFPTDPDRIASKAEAETSVTYWMRQGAKLALTIEIPYYGTPEFMYDIKNVKKLGVSITDALLETFRV